MKDIGEWILFSEKSNTKIRGNEGEGTIEISYGIYILGPITSDYLLGYKGFEIEYTWAKRTIAEVVKGLTKKEWNWVEMKLREVRALKFKGPIEWDPKNDPRQDWRIQEIQSQNQIKNQNLIKNTQKLLGEAESQTKQISAEIRELAGPENTRQPIIQETVAQGSRRTSNEPGTDQKFKAETAVSYTHLTLPTKRIV